MIFRKKFNLKYLLTVFVLVTAQEAFATIDYLDKSFGPDATGIVTSILNSGSVVNGMAIDGTGNIVVAGNTIINSVTSLLLARYSSAGVFDNSFGNNGVVTYLSGPQSNASAVAIDSSGNIVVAGNDGSNNIILLRYTTAGILDTSFGSGGVATLAIGDGSSTAAMVIDANDKIVVAGNSVINGIVNLFIARFNSDGTLDTSFGTSSGYTTITSNNSYSGTSLAIDLNAKLVVVGSVSTNNGSDFLIVRFDTNGQLDTSFNTTGVVTTNINGNNQSNALSVVIDSFNRIVASGSTINNNNNTDVVVRYNNDGSLDTAFGVNSDGIVTNSIGTNSKILASLIDLNGNIFTGGFSDNNFAVARYTVNGSLDTTFGQDGIVLTTINAGSQINAVALQADGRAVAGGLETEFSTQEQHVALVRYNKNNTDFINILNPVNNSVQKTKAPIISGTSSAANASVQIYIDGVLSTTISTDGSGNWTTQSPALSVASHTILVNLVVSSVIVVSEKVNFTVLDNIGEDNIFIYTTVNQTTTTDNVFQLVNFTNSVTNSNIWTTPNANTLQYLAPVTGKFFITVTGEVGIVTASLPDAFDISLRGLKNGTEVPGSQCNARINVGLGGTEVKMLANSSIVTLTQNDTIQLQFATTSTLGSGMISGRGNGTVRPSATATIIRLQ